MPDIVLTTLNARFIHTAYGLRYLLANLGELRPRAALAEFDIHQRPLDIAEALLAHDPKILGLGVYIWNAVETAAVVAALKRVRPELIVVLGGPEVSYETEQQAIAQAADYIITGEADLKFAELCRQLLAGARPAAKLIPAEPPDLRELILPYDLYTDADLAHRVVYVEASRGCPFGCEFCLSSLDVPVREAPLPEFLGHLQRLFDRGLKGFKFVDRTFNVNLDTARTVLEFLLARCRPGHCFHFEMIPDRLPESLRAVIARFAPGALQFEVGVQSFNAEVCRRIHRRQDFHRLEDNFRFLRTQTGVHIHADLILGLPGETLASMAAGFDRLVELGPQEIQVGILKRLRGTPITRHDDEWQMVYNPQPPYEILQNKLIDFATMQKLRRFARYWDLVANSGNFVETTPLLWSEVGQASRLSQPEHDGPSACSDPLAGELRPLSPSLSPSGGEGDHRAWESVRCGVKISGTGGTPVVRSPFWSFLRWSEWLFARIGRTDSIALARLAEFFFRYLTEELRLPIRFTAETLLRDWQRAGRRDPPVFLREHLPAVPAPAAAPAIRTSRFKRQARHRAAQ